jgi:hypothetical protein
MGSMMGLGGLVRRVFILLNAGFLSLAACKTPEDFSDVKDDQTNGAQQAAPAQAAAPQLITQLDSTLKAKILEAMRLNRQTFQEQKVLDRYSEKRPAIDLPVDYNGTQIPLFASCGLMRKPNDTDPTLGEPIPQYPWVKTQAPDYQQVKIRHYEEAEIVDCLKTSSGLAGKKPEPLQQHYYCGFTGFSPDIRSCFTFQIRVSSSVRSAVDDFAIRDNGDRYKLEKRWAFAGTPQEMIDAKAAKQLQPHVIESAFRYCSTDGRPEYVEDKDNGVVPQVSDVFPDPTKPTCYISLTQPFIFKAIMGGLIDIPIPDQISFLSEYYDCPSLQAQLTAGTGKISQATYDQYCSIDPTAWD